jgi:hypothetical protein
MMAWAGYLLTVLGFLAGAFLASLDPVEMQWRWFVPCLLIGSIGVFLVKRSSHASARSDETLANNRDHVEGSLDSILENLAVLDAGKADIPPYELRFEIDRRFRTDLNRFVAARESLVHIYGLQAYADIMSAFALRRRRALSQQSLVSLR